MVFLCLVALSFATGSSCGIFVTTISIVMPPAAALGADIPLVIGALMSAAAFGSQACFYSDARVLAAQGCGCNLIDHAGTQLPYTLVAAGVAFCRFGTRRLSRARGNETGFGGPFFVRRMKGNSYRVVTLHKLVRLPKRV